MALVLPCSMPLSSARATAEAPPVASACEIDYPPFCIVGNDGQVDGFSVELLRAALAAMSREVSFRTGTWNEVRGMLERGEIAALPLVGRTPEREKKFDFTVPYMALHGAIVVRDDCRDIVRLEDLRGRRVAVMKGDNAEEFLRRRERGLDIHTTASFEDALRELAAGKHDAVVVQRLVAIRLITETGLKNLRIVERPVEGFRQDFCFAVKEGDRDTLALLNEGLALVIADGTYRRLHAKWFAALELPANRRLVIGGDWNYPPFEFLDAQGRPAGYNTDLTRAVARELGLEVEVRLGPWAEIVEELENGEIDLIHGMFYLPEREARFDFSQPHSVNHYVSVIRRGDGKPPATMEDLRGRRLVVQRGDVIYDLLVANGLDAQVTALEDQEDVLRELAAGKHDCAITVRVSSLYFIQKHGWTNLLLGKKPFAALDYCFAVRKGQKALLAQFNEGLNVVEKNGEYRKIHEKWLGVYQEDAPHLLLALRYSAMVLVPLLLVLLLVFGWTWLLRRQVAARTRELKESLERFQLLAESAPVGIVISDKNENTLFVSRRFTELYGYTRNDMPNVHAWWPLAYPDPELRRRVRESWAETIQRVNQTGERIAPLEFPVTCRDGSVRHTEFRLASTDKLHFVVLLDITERRRAEDALRENEAYVRAVIDNLPVGVAVNSVDPEVKFSYMNDNFPNFYRTTREALMGDAENFWEAVYEDPEFREKIRHQVLADCADGDPGRMHWENVPITRQGRIVAWVCARNIPIPERKLMISTVWDVTGHRKIEEQLLQSQKMEAVGRLAGGVAHDYNNMLSVIIGYVEMAIRRATDDERLRGYLDEVLKAGRRSAEITRQLLAFARKQTISPRIIDLNETVEGMLKMLRRLIGEDIDLAWMPDPGLGTVNLDPSQVDQVLVNLCVNARDAISGAGKITIETRNVYVDAAQCAVQPGLMPGNFVMLAVSDDGCGMDRETVANIFEPFFTTKGLHGGTGLGLPMVYGIVKQNDGFVNVYSEPGKGSTFKIYLPRADGKAVAEDGGTVAVTPGRGETILLVEDEKAILPMYREMLDGIGYRTLAAASPAEAIALAGEHRAGLCLLITDVVMPGMTGRELAVKIREICPGIKVLYMSGYTANVIAHHGVLDEGVNFIQKPIPTNDLAAKVRQVLDAPWPAG